MPFTVFGLILGIIFCLLGIKRKQKAFLIPGLILLVSVLTFWTVFLIRNGLPAV